MFEKFENCYHVFNELRDKLKKIDEIKKDDAFIYALLIDKIEMPHHYSIINNLLECLRENRIKAKNELSSLHNTIKEFGNELKKASQRSKSKLKRIHYFNK